MHLSSLSPVPSGSGEDGESAERRGASQSRDAARSPEGFWEGSVCLSRSQGNGDTPVSDITEGRGRLKRLIGCPLPPQDSPLTASDWAVAVCRHLGGSAWGSAHVAKGTGSSSDITEALRWAEQFARQKTQR